jgi:hypothetical protein
VVALCNAKLHFTLADYDRMDFLELMRWFGVVVDLRNTNG